MEFAEAPRTRVTGRLVFGLVVICLGVIFLLDQLHLAEARQLLRFLPVFPLLLGLMLLTGVGFRRHVAGGTVLCLVSTFLLLRALGWLDVRLWMLWPVALIVVGGWLVVASLRGPASRDSAEKSASTIEAFALWSGSSRKVVSEDFRGGEVTAIMGGHEIDLRPAKMASGTAVIDLFVWWGGVEIKVPADWKVTNEALPILGGVDDKTRAPEGEVRGHLVLKGPIIMGGVEVKN
jgi:predicted membrane protein